MLEHGKLITLYGINNLGKSTQAHLLVKRLEDALYKAIYQKYAVYTLDPSGVLLNEYLRKGNPYDLSAETFQTLQILNRTQFEPQLREWLKDGAIVVAEDYVGTGIAWGVGAGLSLEYLERANSHLLKEDMAFYFYGSRFSDGIEKNHLHEQDNELTERVATVHSMLAQKYNRTPIAANRPGFSTEESIAAIADEVRGHVSALLASDHK